MIGKKTEKADLERKKGVFLQIGIIVALAIVLIAFEWTSRPQEISYMGTVTNIGMTEEIIPITRQQEVKPPPPPVIPKVTDVLNIVENDVQIDDELIVDDAESDQQMQVDIVEFTGSEEVADEEIFFIVEDMPSFQGKGMEGFREWIVRNLRYPESAAANGISGKVYIQFAINSKGEVVDAVVVKGVDPTLDKEAVRVVMSSPRWEPGRQRGKAVKVQFTFPINFVL
jgi:periplasmic protein TonB